MAGYRPDIDGLRALAVTYVVAFHFSTVKSFGGFVGVDIFFVISGYLITRNILNDLSLGKFSLKAFYSRRVFRLYPALLVVTSFVLIAGFFLNVSFVYANIGRNVISSSLFSSNILQIMSSGYFGPDASKNPMLHLWSLGVEEQFYLVWPLALLISRGRAPRVIALTMLASFMANILLIHDNALDFYSPMSRAWEFGVGAALALPRPQGRAGWCHAASIAGCGLLTLALVILAPSWSYPGWKALLPAAGAGLLIAAGPRACANRCLTHPLAVYLGRVSYPLYLWHWPLITFYRARYGTPGFGAVFLLLAASLCLSAMTYHVVEGFFREPSRRTGRTLSGLVGGSLFLGLLGYAVHLSGGLPMRFGPQVRVLAGISDPIAFFDFAKVVRAPACFEVEPDLLMSKRPNACVEERHPLILLWGDSYAATLYPGFRKLADRNGYGIAQFTTGGSPPFFLDERSGDGHLSLARLNGEVLQAAERLKPDLIVLDWLFYDLAPRELSDEQAGAAIVATISKIHEKLPASHILVVGPVPFWEGGIVKVALEALQASPTHQVPERIKFGVSPRVWSLDEVLRRRIGATPATYISALNLLCDRDGCLARLGKNAYDLSAMDTGHLTEAGSIYFIDRMMPVVEGLLAHRPERHAGIEHSGQ